MRRRERLRRRYSPQLLPLPLLTEVSTCERIANLLAQCYGMIVDLLHVSVFAASSPTLSCGEETQQYQRLFTNFPRLMTALSPMVSAEDLADKLYFSARLITKGTWEEASLGGVTNSNKLRNLMKSVLSQVELNAANYDKFVTVLNEFDGLQDVVQLLEPV